MILWRAIADGMYPICSQKSMPSWSDCVKECGTGATQRAEETNGASHCALKLPDLLPQFCCSRAVPRGDPLARARPGVPRQCRRGVAVLVLQVQTGSAGLWADPIPTLEGDGCELSVKIRPEENCGFSGPRHQDNSTPNRGEIVSKKGVRASEQLIPSRTRDTAPFICLGTGCHCSTQSGSLRSLCRHPRHCIGRRGIAMK